MQRKTIADDVLISTDIDRLIKCIYSKKRIEINALARELGIASEQVKKWVVILENEGYVNVEYHFFNEFVVWAGVVEDTPIKEEEATDEKEFKPEERIERILERIGEKSEAVKPEKEIVEKYAEPAESEEPKEPEELTFVHFHSPPRDNLENVSPSPLEKEEADSLTPKENSKPSDKENELKEAQPFEKEIEETASLKKSLSESMGQIKIQKEEIEKLKAQREKLLTDTYIPLEVKFKASLDNLTEKILEKERKIIEIKERVVELPSKVDEATKIEIALKRIKHEFRNSAYAHKQEMEKLGKSIREEDAHLKLEIESMEKEIKTKRIELNTVANSLSETESQEHEIKKLTDALNEQRAHLNEVISSSYSSLSALSQSRTGLKARLENVKIALDAQTNEVEQYYARIEKIKNAEINIKEYFTDYQNKISMLDDYVGQSEKELAKLHELAEVKYIRSYLDELESLSSTYGNEIEAVNAQAHSIEERIQEVQQNLNNFLTESRELVKSLEKKTIGKDFEKLASKMKQKQAEMLAIVEEKSSEFEKIKAENPIVQVPGPIKKKPVRKRKKKENDEP